MEMSWQAFVEMYGPLIHGKSGRYTTDRELEALLTLAVHRAPYNILEIGTAFGHTTVNLAVVCPWASISTFDVCQEMGYDEASHYAHEVPTKEEAGREIEAANGDIQNRVLRVLEAPDNIRSAILLAAPYDFIFIDGDHTYESVLLDTQVAIASAEDDARIIWDDYCDNAPGVQKLINALNPECVIVRVLPSRMCFVDLSLELKNKLLERLDELCQLIT